MFQMLSQSVYLESKERFETKKYWNFHLNSLMDEKL